MQIICVVGFLEMHGENSVALEADGQKHYVRGGKPGYYPFKGRYPHPVPLDLGTRSASPTSSPPSARRRRSSRSTTAASMIGLFGLLSASKGLIVPGLDKLALTPYARRVHGAVRPADGGLPFVADMAQAIGTYGYLSKSTVSETREINCHDFVVMNVRVGLR